MHVLCKGRKLILGGVEIPHELGLLGHSDADVAVHAVMDSLLGAAALGDIGKYFPDTDPNYSGVSSIKLLEKVCEILHSNNYEIENIDVTIVAQRPKLILYIETMRRNISQACGINISQVSVKATTEERLGFTGGEKGISSYAVCLLK